MSGPRTDCFFQQILQLCYHDLLLLDRLLIHWLLLRLLLHLHQLLLTPPMFYLHHFQLLLQPGYHLYILKRQSYLVLQFHILCLPPLIRLCHLKQLGLDLPYLHLLHHLYILPVHLADGLLRLDMRLQPCILDLKSLHLCSEG